MSRTNKPQVVYAPRPDTSDEDELNSIAAVYRFILNCRAKKAGGPTPATLDNDGKIKEASANVPIIIPDSP